MKESDQQQSKSAKRVGPDTQDVRFATTMTGGVSLAIWMGGVARELNLLEHASRFREEMAAADPLPEVDAGIPIPPDDTRSSHATRSRALYLRLLELLDLTVNTDILSGTSAGGINGALLGFTRSRGLDLGILRDVWLETGSFERLLRDPGDTSPPALLQGDAVLLKGLKEGIGELAKQKVVIEPRSDERTTVLITTTLLAGETSRFTDDFGTTVQDVEHRGLFRFDENDLGFDENDLRDDENRAALALAARCSASYPAAFEPAFVPHGQKVDDGHPDMSRFSNTTRDQFVADGGLLLNKPIKPLIEEVFTRPASRQVRRVLLYVVPLTGEAPDAKATPRPETLDDPPTFAGALLKDVGALVGQSISAELRAIRQHNETVAGMAETRLRVAELGALAAPDQGVLDGRALADYRRRTSRALARPLVTALMRALTTMPTKRMPNQWAEALAPGGSGADDCLDAVAAHIARPWPAAVPALGATAAVATFGTGPLEGAKVAVLSMVSDGWLLASDSADREALSEAAASTHDAVEPANEPNLATLADGLLGPIEATDPMNLAELAVRFAVMVEAPVEPRRATGSLRDRWRDLAAAVVSVGPLLRRLAGQPAGTGILEPEREVARRELTTLLDYLDLPDQSDPEDEQDALRRHVASRLFELSVVTSAMVPMSTPAEQRVGLVQVSADTRCALAPDRAFASDKLTGIQLSHFGAFYKSSWRANDWMWGRLDGAGWLVNVLLDPRRVQVMAERSGRPDKVSWFLERVEDLFPALFPMTPDVEARIRNELGFLDRQPGPGEKPPKQLPEVSMWIAALLQRRITVEELPVVATEVLLNPTAAADDWAVEVLKHAGTPAAVVAGARGATTAIVDGKWSKAQKEMRELVRAQAATSPIIPADEEMLVERLRDCPVSQETIAGEVGQPLFTRTVTKAVAVGTAATAEAQETPVILKPALGSVRKLTLLAYRLTKLNHGNRRSLAFTGLGLVGIGIFLLSWNAVVAGIGGFVAIGAGVYLLLLVSWRNVRTVWAALGMTAVAIAIMIGVALAIDDSRDWLFETPKAKQHQGWVSRHALSWLNESSEHALRVWIGLVLVVVVFGAWIVSLRRRLKKAEKKVQQQT